MNRGLPDNKTDREAYLEQVYLYLDKGYQLTKQYYSLYNVLEHTELHKNNDYISIRLCKTKGYVSYTGIWWRKMIVKTLRFHSPTEYSENKSEFIYFQDFYQIKKEIYSERHAKDKEKNFTSLPWHCFCKGR